MARQETRFIISNKILFLNLIFFLKHDYTIWADKYGSVSGLPRNVPSISVAEMEGTEIDGTFPKCHLPDPYSLAQIENFFFLNKKNDKK